MDSAQILFIHLNHQGKKITFPAQPSKEIVDSLVTFRLKRYILKKGPVIIIDQNSSSV